VVILLFFFIPLHAQTTIAQADDQWQLFVDGEAFNIKGVTIDFDQDTTNYNTYFEDLKFLNVNSIRLWNHNKYTIKLLDAAHKYGIKVMVGIWMRYGRPDMEAADSFDYLTDMTGTQVMYKDAINAVERYKNHPAVLTWDVGNEVY